VVTEECVDECDGDCDGDDCACNALRVARSGVERVQRVAKDPKVNRVAAEVREAFDATDRRRPVAARLWDVAQSDVVRELLDALLAADCGRTEEMRGASGSRVRDERQRDRFDRLAAERREEPAHDTAARTAEPGVAPRRADDERPFGRQGPSAPTAAAEVRVPVTDLGDDFVVSDIYVRPAERIEQGLTLVTLESDQVAIDVPSPISGVVGAIEADVGNRVTPGDLLMVLEPDDEAGPRTVEVEQPDESDDGETPEEAVPVDDGPAVVRRSPEEVELLLEIRDTVDAMDESLSFDERVERIQKRQLGYRFLRAVLSQEPLTPPPDRAAGPDAGTDIEEA
jgi:biotin carboxyl carrier protein